MKNIMKELTAALLALSCLPVTGLTAAAEGLPYYWGEGTWEAFEGYERINDHGVFTQNQNYRDAEFYVNPKETDTFSFIMVTPRANLMRFVLRDDVDPTETADKIAGIVERYVPGIRDHVETGQYAEGYPVTYHFWCDSVSLGNSTDNDGRTFELYYKTKAPDNKADIEAGILLGLAKSHLISEFYGFGEIGLYSTNYISDEEHLDQLADTYWDGKKDVPVEWDAVQAYLDKQYPGLTTERYEGIQYGDVLADGTREEMPCEYYRINGADALSNSEKAELSLALYGEYKVELLLIAPAGEEEGMTTRRNALLKPGDVTLDTDITIVDVIALNRNIMTGDPLCDTAKKNADINGNGAPDEADALAILKEVVELTD
nr:dockerin type I repeat-containing protein [Oscillospiraceae bacterium]